jgi:hypothetical protein
LVPAVTVDSDRTAASTMPYRLTLVWAMAAALAMLRAATANRRFFWLMGSFSGGEWGFDERGYCAEAGVRGAPCVTPLQQASSLKRQQKRATEAALFLPA